MLQSPLVFSKPLIHGVCFDFNGVLVDDEHLHFECFNEVLAPLGITLGAQEYADVYLGFDDRGVFTHALRAHGREADDITVRSLIARKGGAYAARAARELRIFEGAGELVRAVAAQAPVVIVSGALRAEIRGALAVMGLTDVVGAIVAAEDVAACKPDPEGYRAGLARLGEIAGRPMDPARVVAVEDSTAGIAAALGASLRVVAVAHTYARETLAQAGAAAVFARIAELRVADLAAAVVRR
jgi:beta-phosphoglucomutase